MPRRVSDYSPDAGWTILNFASTVGAFMIAVSIIPFLINVVATFINGEPAGDDPWEGNTLEWATTSPAAAVQLRPAAADPFRAAALLPDPRPRPRRGASADLEETPRTRSAEGRMTARTMQAHPAGEHEAAAASITGSRACRPRCSGCCSSSPAR